MSHAAFKASNLKFFVREICSITSPRTMATGTSRPILGHVNTIITLICGLPNKKRRHARRAPVGDDQEHPITGKTVCSCHRSCSTILGTALLIAGTEPTRLDHGGRAGPWLFVVATKRQPVPYVTSHTAHLWNTHVGLIYVRVGGGRGRRSV